MKKILFTILGLLLFVAVLGGVKFFQIRKMIAVGASFVPPPETVTATGVQALTWETALTAVGSLEAVQGVTVSAELPGKVVHIAFEPGTRVDKGDLLLRQDVSLEEAQLPGAEAAVTLARSNLARAAELLAQKVIAQAEYDAAVANERQAAAAAESIRATIAKKTVRAPFAGHLGIRLVNLGQILKEGDAIVSLQRLDPIFANFLLPQQQLGQLRTGLPVRVTADALPGRTVAGTLTAINPEVDAATRNVRLQATLANPEEKLRPGMFVNTAVVLPELQTVMALPATAILYAPFGDSVFVVEERRDEGTGEARKVLRQQFVRLGEKRGDFVAVASGLKAGETVVSSGVFKLRNGQAVVIDNTLAPAFKLAPTPKDE